MLGVEVDSAWANIDQASTITIGGVTYHVNDMLPDLIDQLTAGDVTVADTRDRTLDGLTTEERMLLQTVVSDMEERPARALMNPTVVKMFQRGLVEEPEHFRPAFGEVCGHGARFSGAPVCFWLPRPS